jgi:hypothetical protein
MSMLFTFPEVLRNRVAELVAREKLDALSPAEVAELDGYLAIEHVLRIAKARARKPPMAS